MSGNRITQFAAALALCSSLFAGPGQAGQLARTSFEDRLLEVAAAVEAGSLEADSAARKCRDIFAGESNSGTLRDVLAGFLHVERDVAFEAGCRAVVVLLETDRLSRDNLRELLHGDNADRKAVLSGRLLRDMYFAHEGRP